MARLKAYQPLSLPNKEEMMSDQTGEVMLRERIANDYMIQCKSSKDFECPHYESCRHEDKDICDWQLDHADTILAMFRGEVEKSKLSEEEIEKVIGKVTTERYLARRCTYQ